MQFSKELVKLFNFHRFDNLVTKQLKVSFNNKILDYFEVKDSLSIVTVKYTFAMNRLIQGPFEMSAIDSPHYASCIQQQPVILLHSKGKNIAKSLHNTFSNICK